MIGELTVEVVFEWGKNEPFSGLGWSAPVRRRTAPLLDAQVRHQLAADPATDPDNRVAVVGDGLGSDSDVRWCLPVRDGPTARRVSGHSAPGGRPTSFAWDR